MTRPITLRRFEIQLTHHATFLYWNLRGLLAQRWGHGPHFEAFAEQPQRTQLYERVEGESISKKVAVMGLQTTAFVWEEPANKDFARELAMSWISDVFEILSPKVVTRAQIRHYKSVPLKAGELKKANDRIVDEFGGLGSGVMNPHLKTVSGLSAQARGDGPAGTDLIETVLFGLWHKEQSSQWFLGPSEADAEWNLGMFHDTIYSHEKGFAEPLKTLAGMLEDSRKQAESITAQTIRRVLLD